MDYLFQDEMACDALQKPEGYVQLSGRRFTSGPDASGNAGSDELWILNLNYLREC